MCSYGRKWVWCTWQRTYTPVCSLKALHTWFKSLVPLSKKEDSLLSLVSRKQIFFIVNNLASWTIIVVMHIIVTLKNGTFIDDWSMMMMSKTMITSIGGWGVGQTQQGAAKSIRNFVHSGTVVTEGIHFEHAIGTLIIVPLPWSILNMYLHTSQKCWEWQLDDLENN